jgi:S-adenosylmethionine decarboxylase
MKNFDVGIEWLVDASGCGGEMLANLGVLRNLCRKIIEELGLRVVGEGHWHQFPPPGGITAMFLLTESHLSLHTYPESGVATFNLYCCRERPRWDWEDRLTAVLGAKRVVVRRFVRGERASACEENLDDARPASMEETR